MNIETLKEVVDGVTDVAAIGAIAYVLLMHPEMGVESIGAIVSVALGKKYFRKN